MPSVQLHHADCLEHMRTMPANSVDSIVTDPPYGISFMGKQWDHGVPGVEFWVEALRVAKPGAYLLAFGGTRTFHRLACAIEDAGWEMRDTLMWIYGQGFPKSLNVSKSIDDAAGADRERGEHRHYPNGRRYAEQPSGGKSSGFSGALNVDRYESLPATEAAKQWNGWGTALKPAWEPIVMARKPFPGTVAANVINHGTGAINIDGCRIEGAPPSVPQPTFSEDKRAGFGASEGRNGEMSQADGRWPANVLHDGSDEVVALFPETTTGDLTGEPRVAGNTVYSQPGATEGRPRYSKGDSGSASRFFYCAKASKADRDEGLEAFELKTAGGMQGRQDGTMGSITKSRNIHPTVKPTELMRWCCRLVTQPGGTVFDPFMGSGSTGKAAVVEGFGFIGCDIEAPHVAIAHSRCEYGKRIRHEELGLFADTL